MPEAPVDSEFLEAILGGHRQQAFVVAQRYLHTQGLTSLYEDVVTPALRELGSLWERNLISIADEHLATALAQSAIAALYAELKWPRATYPAVVGCVAGERHEIGARMVADLLELDGWRVLYTGGDTPIEALLTTCRRTQPLLVALSVSQSAHLATGREVIAKLRAMLPTVKILIGGRALGYLVNPTLLGADATAPSARMAVAVASAWKQSSRPFTE